MPVSSPPRYAGRSEPEAPEPGVRHGILRLPGSPRQARNCPSIRCDQRLRRAEKPRNPGDTEPPRSAPRDRRCPCGGTHAGGGRTRIVAGLSPHVRGNRSLRAGPGAAERSIPARAEEPCTAGPSIPACAGEPRRSAFNFHRRKVYPRMCGGTLQLGLAEHSTAGLSPHVRGNLGRGRPDPDRSGSIPACAGEPSPTPRGSPTSWVYPRMCGGTSGGSCPHGSPWGLSPLVRGNLSDAPALPLISGSIPACAGEPASSRSPASTRRVYPRMCGGTGFLTFPGLNPTGLSPHVRGNLGSTRLEKQRDGSIPACAGEPATMRAGWRASRVYPRMCGGTGFLTFPGLNPTGLSPHVRGNRSPISAIGVGHGSIPACAGEPPGAGGGISENRVYPRMCGGTGFGRTFHAPIEGLSPHVRGNRDGLRAHSRRTGSIPACAGEPKTPGQLARRYKVYPRMCGGTARIDISGQDAEGLSPHVRGNHAGCEGLLMPPGSIPACAGEPATGADIGAPFRVYPRMCGGTTTEHVTPLPTQGLSPHVRGNL